MSDQPNKIKRLQDYRPPAFLVDRVELIMRLEESQTTVQATLNLRRNPADAATSEPLRLDGRDLLLEALTLDGRALTPAEYQRDEEQLILWHPPETFQLQIVTRINPKENSSLEGLYWSNGLYCTQCEAEGFRKITYYPDRPDVMALFRVRLEAERSRYPVLLANGNRLESGELADGFHYVVWEDPFRKPCYLFAVVAGSLACVTDSFTTRSGRRIALEIYVEPVNQGKCGHALASLQRAMRWDEERFGLEYDLDLYMIVAVSAFNMGAMENKGLNLFNDRYILADAATATDDDYFAIENVVAHEYFHNWTGNRITCRDWFQLSLKEGLTVFRDQLFSADMGSPTVQRIRDVRFLRARQFPEDAGPLAHPVQPEAYEEINNFYTMTVYEKGAELVRMLHTVLGEEGFRRGLGEYCRRHDGQAVTVEEWVAALEAASGEDLQQFRLWYRQAGTPLVSIATTYDPAAASLTMVVKQSCPPTPGQPDKAPLHIPLTVSLLDGAGQPLPLRLAAEPEARGEERILSLRQAEEQFCWVGLQERPVVSALRGFSAPVRLESNLTEADRLFLWSRESDPFNRWEAAQGVMEELLLARINRASGSLPAGVVRAFAATLADARLEPAETALILTLPEESRLLERMTEADPTAVRQARESFRRELASVLQEAWQESYDRCRDDSPYRYTAQWAGRRSLKGLALDYLAALPEVGIALAASQYRQADNMSDRLRALTRLVHDGQGAGEAPLADFYLRWRHEPLVMDKWLTVQATAPHPNVLERIEHVMGDPVFDRRNPNRVRALVGAFSLSNLERFHDPSGAGYRFLAERIRELDPVNPQLAARLAGGFARWRLFEPKRREGMRQQLQELAGMEGISRDLQEIVGKSLK